MMSKRFAAVLFSAVSLATAAALAPTAAAAASWDWGYDYGYPDFIATPAALSPWPFTTANSVIPGPALGWQHDDDGPGYAYGRRDHLIRHFYHGRVVRGPVLETARTEDHAWIASCQARHPSFNPATGRYIGRDGRPHYCP